MMDEKDPTTIIRMLNDLTSSSDDYRRSNNISLRLSGAGITPSTSVAWKNDDGCTNSLTSIEKSHEISRLRASEKDTFSVHSGCIEEETPPKRRRMSELRRSVLSNSSETDIAPSSPFEWRRLKGELISLRTRMSYQETTIQQLHNIRKQMEEVFQKEKNMLEMQANLDKETIKQLELRVESARDKLQESHNAQSIMENEMFQVKAKLEKKISTLLEENAKLSEKIRCINAAENESSPKVNARNEVIEAQMNLAKAQERIAELESKLRDSHLYSREAEIQKIDLQNARIQIDKLECEKELWAEGKLLISRAARTNELEKELSAAKITIAALRESVKGKLLIEEQMSNILLRLEHTEKIEKELADLQVKYHELVTQLAEYCDIGLGDGPSALRKEIHRLQQAEIILTAEEGQIRSRVDSVERENYALQRNYEEAKTIAIEMTASTEKLNKIIGRLQKKVLLITRERDSYRQQLDLYEKEMNTSDSNTPTNDRIVALERTLQSYRDLVSKLEADLAVPDVIASHDECHRLRDENERLKTELEHRVLKGDFNCNSRILHFRMNPAAIANHQNEDRIKALYNEVEELRAKVQSGNSESYSGIPSSYAQEIADLKKSHEIKIARLKDAFKTSSQEYRQACYQLFGWRVDRTKEGRYKLSSQYAESPDDFLYFKVGDGVDLLETPFSATLVPLINQHLQIQHSVPMFLNAVQVELFNQQTASNLI